MSSQRCQPTVSPVEMGIVSIGYPLACVLGVQKIACISFFVFSCHSVPSISHNLSISQLCVLLFTLSHSLSSLSFLELTNSKVHPARERRSHTVTTSQTSKAHPARESRPHTASTPPQTQKHIPHTAAHPDGHLSFAPGPSLCSPLSLRQSSQSRA